MKTVKYKYDVFKLKKMRFQRRQEIGGIFESSGDIKFIFSKTCKLSDSY